MKTECYLQYSGMKVNFSKKCIILRFLISKLVREGITEEEYQKIWILTNDIVDNYVTNNYLSKIQLAEIQTELLRKISNIDYSKSIIGKIWIDCVLSSVILPPHEYFGLKLSEYGQLLLKVKIHYRITEKLSFPEKPYIGVGYKDKGSASKLTDKAYISADKFYYQSKRLEVKESDFGVDLQHRQRIWQNVESLGRTIVI